MPATFDAFFKKATATEQNRDGNAPYDYQRRLAGDTEGRPCSSQLISIPTGLGKTAAVVLAWLWNRVAHPDAARRETWPRRLVYCLPMRTLVEQTRDEITKWIGNLLSAAQSGALPLSPDAIEHLRWLAVHAPVILMSGEENDSARRDWDIHPERPAILIGTQDMLLSRALNRGYGMARARWPMHFGLLNNDCLWVMDETQLMGSALWATAQLDWMRQDRFRSFRPCISWWMSATLGTGFFDTLDRKKAEIPHPEPLSLTPAEETSLSVLKALRPVQCLKPPATPKKKSKSADTDPAQSFFRYLAKSVIEEHPTGHLSLVVCNRVRHAQEIKAAIQTQYEDQKKEVLLLTSRFRRQDRRDTLGKIIAFENARKKGEAHPGLILVSTQVIEAGFDISSARLWSEAAPWPSFLQRLGRLNRDAKLNEHSPKAFVFQVPTKKNETGPYDFDDLKVGAQIVSKLEALCSSEPQTPIRQLLIQLSADLATAKLIGQALEPKPEPFPRAMEVHGLFSTEPDVFGGFTDISPWVRNADANADVSVFWRSFKPAEHNVNAGDGPKLQADEVCAVPVNRFRDFLGSSRRAWIWESKKKRWETFRPSDLCPGMTIMLPVASGGYERALGWTGYPASKLAEAPPPGPFEGDDDDDAETQIGQWVTLETHLADTSKAARQISTSLKLPPEFETFLILSAELHDIGKSLPQWHGKLPTPHPSSASLYAKAPWEIVLDLTQNPSAAKQCLELIQRTSGQRILHRKTVSDASRGGERLHLQLRLKPKRSASDELQNILRERPKLTAFRPGCRHEAASALAMWSHYYRDGTPPNFPALTIYVVAAHHGKVRTVLNSRPHTPGPNVCGIPSDAPQSLPWNSAWTLDFEAANDGASGQFQEDGTFSFSAPGWTGLVADLLGGWEEDASKCTCGAVPKDEPHSLGPFALAYFEALLRAADGQASANPSREIAHDPNQDAHQ
jgi:CRISPR-associated endonuclease/helicase Cas3